MASTVDDGPFEEAEVLLNVSQTHQSAVNLLPAQKSTLGQALKPIMPGAGDENRLAQYTEMVAGRSVVDKRIGKIIDALSEGRVLIDVMDALRRSIGRNGYTGTSRVTDGRVPILGLALAPADANVVDATLWETGDLEFKTRRPHGWKRDFGIGSAVSWGTSGLRRDSWKGRARVPQIPPSMRTEHDMSKRLVLWEPQWYQEQYVHRADVDPALLEPLSGTICIVHEVWDLTPIELAALGAGDQDLL